MCAPAPEWITASWCPPTPKPQRDPRREPLDQYPGLRDCVDNRGERALASPRRGRHVLWLPVWMHDKVNTCL